MRPVGFFLGLFSFILAGCSTAKQVSTKSFEDFVQLYSNSKNLIELDKDLFKTAQSLSLEEKFNWGQKAISRGVTTGQQQIQHIAAVMSQAIEYQVPLKEKVAFVKSHDVFPYQFDLVEKQQGGEKIFTVTPPFGWFSSINLPSALADALLGLRPEKLKEEEANLDKTQFRNENVGLGMSRGVLNTSYAQFEAIIRAMKPSPGETFVDIGAGHCRLGFLLGLKYPQLKFKGYEIVSARVEEAKKAASDLGLGPHIEFIEQDLSDSQFSLPAAEYFYMFNPVNSPTRQKIWADLKRVGKRKKFTLVTLLMPPDEIPKWLRKTGEINFGRKINAFIWKN